MLAGIEMGIENSILDEKIDRKRTERNLGSHFYQKREIMRLPPSAKFIMYLLRMKGAMNRKRIIQETLMPDRTVGFALKLLLEKNLIKKEDRDGIMNPSSGQRRRRHKRDRRITKYNLISSILPYEII